MHIISKSEKETLEIAKKVGFYIKDNFGIKIGFTGDLGAGKTCFIKGVMSVILKNINVTSPTYSIMDEYEYKKRKIYHVDLYRINSIDELFGTGFLEVFNDINNTFLIEWSDRLKNLNLDVKINIINLSKTERKIIIEGIEDKNII